VTKVLGFVQGLLCGAKKPTHLAYLRRDPMMPALLGIKRVPSQSTFTRFFQGFTNAGKNLTCFRPPFAWPLQQLPSKAEGCALDLDSTRLLHEDGHQDGVEAGYTRVGTKPCLHPLLAIFSEVRLVAAFWLRPGNCGCANNAVGFFLGSVGQPAVAPAGAGRAGRLRLLLGRAAAIVGTTAREVHRRGAADAPRAKSPAP